jgi:hypothetical protein
MLVHMLHNAPDRLQLCDVALVLAGLKRATGVLDANHGESVYTAPFSLIQLI